MWKLETPWYELIIRGTCIYIFVFVALKIWGKKHLGEMAAFDFIILLFISEAIQNALIDDEKSITGGIIMVTIFLLWNTVINRLTYYSRKMEKILDGEPRVVIKDGKIDEMILHKEKITEQELNEAIRLEGVRKISDVKLATLETNGHISVIK